MLELRVARGKNNCSHDFTDGVGGAAAGRKHFTRGEAETETKRQRESGRLGNEARTKILEGGSGSGRGAT